MIRAAAVLACALVASGCATVVQDDWQPQATHPPLPAKHIEVPEKDLRRACGIQAPGHLYGCAIRVAEARVCIIYTAPQPAAWVMEHEHRHCAGWDHGPTFGKRTRVAAISTH